MLIDITRTLGADTLTWPGDAAFTAQWRHRIEDGDCANVRTLKLSNHSGTHLDAPRHLLRDGETLDRLPVDRFRMTAHVIAAPSDAKAIEPAHIDPELIQPGEAVLFKTANALLSRNQFSETFVYLTPETAETLVRQRVGLVGIDYLSIDAYDDENISAHKILLQTGALILEDIDLRAAAPGRYTLWCLPMNFADGDGAPCRAVLETT